MHRTEPSRLQSIALQLSDKLGSLVENNEKLMELKSGNMFGFQPKGNMSYQLVKQFSLLHDSDSG